MKKIILLLLAAFLLTNSEAQTNHAKGRDSLKTLLQNEKQDTARVKLLIQLGIWYSDIKPDTSMLLALEALSLSKRIGFVKGEATSLGRMAHAYWVLGNRPKAFEASLQSLKLHEKINNFNGIAGGLSGIGTMYFDQEEFHQAIDYFLKAIKLAEQANNKRTVVFNLVNIGLSYLGLKQYDSARVYAQKGFDAASKINEHRSTGNALSLMGDIYSQTGQKKLALEYYRLSIPYAKMTENYRNLNGIYLGMAKLFEVDGKTDSTLFYANQSFQISRRVGQFTVGVVNASNFLSSIYKKKGMVDSAFYYLQVATSAKDSLSSQQKINQIHNLLFDEKLRQQEIASAELKAKEDRKHNLQFAALAIGLITFIILFFALSRSIIVKTKFIEFFGVLGLLAVFEFINLFIHPYLALATNDSPVLMLGVLIAIGALLIPFHHKLERWITKIMVEKNKKIRLDAAKKTIENLEGTPVT